MREPFSYRRDPAVPEFADDRPIIIFDGYCVLCSRWANFVLRQDRAATFRLLPAQSALASALYVHFGLDPENYETNILVADGRAWVKKLLLVVRRSSFFGLPLPPGLAPGGLSYEYAADGRFCFHVEIKHVLTGLIVGYRGWLLPCVHVEPRTANASTSSHESARTPSSWAASQ